MRNARGAALDCLTDLRKKGAWPDLTLKTVLSGLRADDAALASALVYGTVQNMRLLDFYIAAHSSLPLGKISPFMLDCLRLGACQILLMDKIPAFAAISETVALVKRSNNSRAAGFANAVLRALDAKKHALPTVDTGDSLRDLGIVHSHPDWFVARMVGQLGFDQAQALLRANGEPFAHAVRVNTLKTSADRMLRKLAELGIEARAHSFLPDCIELDSLGGLIKSGALDEGLVYVQDAASQLAVWAQGLEGGERVLDLCAAPGGKSLLAAQLMGGRGQITACDLYAHKAALIGRNARVYAADIIAAQTCDARAAAFDGVLFDRAICDVPCSNTGIIRKKPDLRLKKEPDLSLLTEVQYAILRNAATHIKPGGTVVYSTCSVLFEENQAVVERFLKAHAGFSLCGFSLFDRIDCPDGMRTLYPHTDGCDGFFIAKLRRI